MSCRQFRAWRSIRMACWRSRSAKITAWFTVSMQWSFQRRHLSPFTPLVHVLQIERSCGCQRFVISLSKSGVIRRQCRHNGLQRRWSGPLRSEGRQIFAKACPKSGPSPRNDWISEETWLALRAHGWLRTSVFETCVGARLSCSSACLRAGKRARILKHRCGKLTCD